MSAVYDIALRMSSVFSLAIFFLVQTYANKLVISSAVSGRLTSRLSCVDSFDTYSQPPFVCQNLNISSALTVSQADCCFGVS